MGEILDSSGKPAMEPQAAQRQVGAESSWPSQGCAGRASLIVAVPKEQPYLRAPESASPVSPGDTIRSGNPVPAELHSALWTLPGRVPTSLGLGSLQEQPPRPAQSRVAPES